VLTSPDVDVTDRALSWEAAGRTSDRQVWRVERLTQSAASTGKNAKQEAYLIDLQLTCKGANRNDITKFVRSYLPEAKQHFISD
jgi:hypothetical protein